MINNMGKKVSEDTINQMVSDYISGNTIISIPKKYYVSEDTVRKYFKERGISKHKLNDDDIQYILELYCNDQWDEIFKKYPDINRQKVYNIASKNKCRKTSYFWNEEDVEFLKSNYNSMSLDDFVNHYGGKYSYKAIGSKAKKLGLTISREWTPEEKDIFISNYSIIPIKQLMELLPNRSYNSLVNMGAKLGIQSYNYLKEKYTQEQKEFIYNNFGKMTDSEIANILNKPVIGI